MVHLCTLDMHVLLVQSTPICSFVARRAARQTASARALNDVLSGHPFTLQELLLSTLQRRKQGPGPHLRGAEDFAE